MSEAGRRHEQPCPLRRMKQARTMCAKNRTIMTQTSAASHPTSSPRKKGARATADRTHVWGVLKAARARAAHKRPQPSVTGATGGWAGVGPRTKGNEYSGIAARHALVALKYSVALRALVAECQQSGSSSQMACAHGNSSRVSPCRQQRMALLQEPSSGVLCRFCKMPAKGSIMLA